MTLNMSFFNWVMVPVLLSLYLYLCAVSVTSTPITSFGPTIPQAGGVALSGDGAIAFVCTYSTSGGSVYVIPLPINASSNPNPSPYWSSPSSSPAQYYYIAASASNTPQLVYLLDNHNAQLVSLAITSPPARNTSLVYDLGSANQYLVGGMTYLGSIHLLYLTLNTGFDGGARDRIAVLDPTSSSPSLLTLYATSFSAFLAGLAVSPTWIYFGTATIARTTNIAQIWAIPLTSMNTSTMPTLLYTTANIDLDSLRIGDLVHPAGLVLNSAESILYIVDIGNSNVHISRRIQGIYALNPLQPGSANLSTVYAYTNLVEELSDSFSLSSDQSTLYFARRGNQNGLCITTNANSSIPTSPFLSVSSSTGGVTSTPTSSSPLSYSASAPSSASSVPTGGVTSGTRQSSSVPPTPVDHSTSGMSTGQEVGVAVGVVLVVVVAFGVAFRFRKYWMRGRDLEEPSIIREPMLSAGPGHVH